MVGKIPGDEGNYAPGLAGSGEPGAGANRTAARTGTGAGKKTGPKSVERVTALRGLSSGGRPTEPQSSLRRMTQRDIFGKEPEIPYVKFEAVARDQVCSLMERQDRMNEEIFYKLSDLRCRIEYPDMEWRGSGGGS